MSNLLEKILSKLQTINDRVVPPQIVAKDTSVVEPSQNITHVYTRQHDVKGLHSHYKGPFRILSRPSQSTIIIKVGQNRDGTDRTELRNWQDCKCAYLREGVQDAARPKRGRPAKPTTPTSPSSASPPTSPDVNNNVAAIKASDTSQNLSIDVSAIDFSVPPPGFKAGNSNINTTRAETWSASRQELDMINRSINTSQPIESSVV